MTKKKVTVVAKTGLHARPANMLIKEAQRYQSTVEIAVDGNIFDAKSLLGILAAGVNCGMEIEILCSGPDEAAACEGITELIENGMNE